MVEEIEQQMLEQFVRREAFLTKHIFAGFETVYLLSLLEIGRGRECWHLIGALGHSL